MPQVYHSNARTNSYTRKIIQNSDLTNIELSKRFGIDVKTIIKWRNRDFLEDKSSRPKTIHYALSSLEKGVIEIVRKITWMQLDELTDTIKDIFPHANRSNVYRTLTAFNINRVPEEKKEEAQKFKEYEPGFLHIDVTYLPKFEGQKYYLFVAIDRATRVIYFDVYKNKTSENATKFLKKCKEFFPFYINHILTDNGAEFTDKFVGGKNIVSGNHKFDEECAEDNIDHRLTAPYTPKTNGMVERVNGTIKNATIKAENYDNIDELKLDLKKFMIFYNFNRRHGSLKKELKVRTPFDAIKSWFKIKPEIFKISPDIFQENAFKIMEQRGET